MIYIEHWQLNGAYIRDVFSYMPVVITCFFFIAVPRLLFENESA
jgi:hypothetical protein